MWGTRSTSFPLVPVLEPAARRQRRSLLDAPTSKRDGHPRPRWSRQAPLLVREVIGDCLCGGHVTIAFPRTHTPLASRLAFGFGWGEFDGSSGVPVDTSDPAPPVISHIGTLMITSLLGGSVRIAGHRLVLVLTVHLPFERKVKENPAPPAERPAAAGMPGSMLGPFIWPGRTRPGSGPRVSGGRAVQLLDVPIEVRQMSLEQIDDVLARADGLDSHLED